MPNTQSDSVRSHRALTRRVGLVLLAVSLSMLSGCMTSMRDYFRNGLKVGPKYERPLAPISEEWIDYGDERVISDVDVPQNWWQVFNDPTLDRLVQMAYGQNLTLREAGFRIYESRALRAYTIGNLFPQSQTAFGSASRQMLSFGAGIQAGGGGNLPGVNRYFTVWNFGNQLSWEIDFWGQYRRAVEAASADLDASIENFDDVLTLLIADVASTYVEIRTLEQRIVYALGNIDTQTRSLELAQTKFNSGAASKLDVTQAMTNLGQTEAAVPEFQRQLRQAENRLCVLLAIPPQDIRGMLEGSQGIPQAPPEVVVGIPAQLLRRRPDVRRAERQVAAQSARIGVAEADLYPAFNINGNIFVRATQWKNLFHLRSFGGNLGPTFSWNILNYGRIVNSVRAEEARFMQLATQYQTVVLNANREAEDAIVAFLRSQEETRAWKKATDAALESRDLIEQLYRGGKADFGRVFVAELVLAQQQDALARSQGSISSNLVEVYRALGGGWELRFENPSDMFLLPEENVPPPDAAQPDGAADPNAAPLPNPAYDYNAQASFASPPAGPDRPQSAVYFPAIPNVPTQRLPNTTE